jgi:hypothetical protein
MDSSKRINKNIRIVKDIEKNTVKGNKVFLTVRGKVFIDKTYYNIDINPVVFQVSEINPSFNVSWNGKSNTVANNVYKKLPKQQ